MDGKKGRNRPFFVDIGAIENITRDHNLLENKVDCDHEVAVTISNGEFIRVETKMSCNLPNGIRIEKVLYIMKFKCNMFFVSRLTK